VILVSLRIDHQRAARYFVNLEQLLA
jgi:hypothetical protein